MISGVKWVHFNALPRVTRERLTRGMNGIGEMPALLAAAREANPTHTPIRIWVVVASAVFGVLVATKDFGEAESSGVWLSRGSALWLGLWTLLFSWGVCRVVLDRLWGPKLPYRRDSYLFPTCVVHAQEPVLAVVPLELLQTIRLTHVLRQGGYLYTIVAMTFQGAVPVEFTTSNRAQAEGIETLLSRFGMDLQGARQRGDLDRVRALDVMFEARGDACWNDPQRDKPSHARVPSPSDGGPIALERGPNAAILRRPFPVALAFTIVAVPLFTAVRNFASDEVIVRRLRAQPGVRVCAWYLQQEHTRHKEEVSDELLPRAAFNAAMAQRHPSALRAFLRRFERSSYAGRARAELQRANAVHRAAYEAQAVTDGAGGRAFMLRLLTWLGQRGDSNVQVRFVPPTTDALLAVDRASAEPGRQAMRFEVASVTPAFSTWYLEQHESRLVTSLNNMFRVVLPFDALHVTRSGHLDLTQRDAAVTVPTFDVTYTLAPTETLYSPPNERPPRAYVGTSLSFHMRMRVPDGGDDLAFDLNVAPPARFDLAAQRTHEGPNTSTDVVIYSAVAARAFARLADRAGETFFRPGSPAFREGRVVPGSDDTDANAAPPARSDSSGPAEEDGHASRRRHHRRRRR